MENSPQIQNPPPASGNSQFHYSTKAILSLAFGILGLMGFGPLAGVPAWILGKIELNEIKAGQSHLQNRGLAQAGFILGIISTVLAVLAFLFFMVFWLFLGGVIPTNLNHLQTS